MVAGKQTKPTQQVYFLSQTGCNSGGFLMQNWAYLMWPVGTASSVRSTYFRLQKQTTKLPCSYTTLR